jgi:hypothetical protein
MTNCRWCKRRLADPITIPGAQEKPHCPGNPSCSWGWDCYAARLREWAEAARIKEKRT